MAAAVGALGGPAAGARASGCAHSRLPPHTALPFVGSFLRWCARPVCLRATAGAAAGLGQLTRACVGGKLLSTWLGTPGWKTRLLKSTPEVECDGWSGGAKKRRWRRWWGRSRGGGCRGAPSHPGGRQWCGPSAGSPPGESAAGPSTVVLQDDRCGVCGVSLVEVEEEDVEPKRKKRKTRGACGAGGRAGRAAGPLPDHCRTTDAALARLYVAGSQHRPSWQALVWALVQSQAQKRWQRWHKGAAKRTWSSMTLIHGELTAKPSGRCLWTPRDPEGWIWQAEAKSKPVDMSSSRRAVRSQLASQSTSSDEVRRHLVAVCTNRAGESNLPFL
eukprot:SAG25_NODE_69_length_17425_cov_289.898476_4_plen_331_part_00